MTTRSRPTFRLHIAAVLALTGGLTACAGPAAQQPPAGPSDDGAGEFAVLAAEAYGRAVSRGPHTLDDIPGADCWECSPETQVLSYFFALDAPVKGGEFDDLEVASTSETAPGRYQVDLQGQRDAVRLFDLEGQEISGWPAGPAHLTVAVSWTDDAWRVDELVIDGVG